MGRADGRAQKGNLNLLLRTQIDLTAGIFSFSSTKHPKNIELEDRNFLALCVSKH
jgi:hypothetical protein